MLKRLGTPMPDMSSAGNSYVQRQQLMSNTEVRGGRPSSLEDFQIAMNEYEMIDARAKNALERRCKAFTARLLLVNTLCCLILMFGGIGAALIAHKVYGGHIEATIAWMAVHSVLAVALLALCWFTGRIEEFSSTRDAVITFGPLIVCCMQFIVTMLYAAEAAGYVHFSEDLSRSSSSSI